MASGYAAFHVLGAVGFHFFGAGFFLAFFTVFVVAVVSESSGTGKRKQGEGEQGLFHKKKREGVKREGFISSL